VAVLDGPVDLSHSCFAGANLRRLDTLVQDPAGQGPMSVHGTHVTSLIFGQPGSPVAGIAPQCRGLIAPVFRDFDERRLSQLDLARAIEQAVQEGAHVINISGGQQAPDEQAEGMLERALRLCEDNNVLVVAAVGNDGCPCLHVPAAVPSVLGAGALGADGKPLETSNWGEAYKSNGILASGENIKGAAPGGGTVSLTGSSFATPIVSGVAALLLSAQVKQGRSPDPLAVREALLHTAVSCQPRDSPECHRYLVGTLNVPGAYASITKGGETVVASINTTRAPDLAAAPVTVGPDTGTPSINTTEAPDLAAGSVTTGADTGTPETAGAGITAAGVGQAAAPDLAVGVPETGIAAASGGIPAEPATLETASLPSASSSAAPAGPPQPGIPSRARSGGVVPAGDCGCDGGAKKGYVFAIGAIGFDFGTEARRDSFRQLMPRQRIGESEPAETVAPNPYDVFQLADYLDNNKSESTNLIWTLNLDATPIYAIEAEQTYAEDVFVVLRSALRNQAVPANDENYVSRVSIPGVLTNRTRRLFSGQILPVVMVRPRGLYTWNEKALVDLVIQGVQRTGAGVGEDILRQSIRNFLDKIYYQLRNLGQTSPDRALNYAATNAFIAMEVLQQGLLSAQMLATTEKPLYSLDTIAVSKSPYCRMDSDCWDVQVTFFNPNNILQARSVYQFTLDVSDEMPVTLAPVHQFFTTS
jgi:cyanobactin maturation PatA/PatG family protease